MMAQIVLYMVYSPAIIIKMNAVVVRPALAVFAITAAVGLLTAIIASTITYSIAYAVTNRVQTSFFSSIIQRGALGTYLAVQHVSSSILETNQLP
jgi:hypothetical protein